MGLHRAATKFIGTMNESTPSLTLTVSDVPSLLALEGNLKADVIIRLAAVSGGSALFDVEEKFSDFWYATAETPQLAVAQDYGLANANFPFLGKGDDLRIVGTLSATGMTFSASAYFVTWEN